MTTIEQLEELIADTGEVDPFYMHLYEYEGEPTGSLTRIAMCGLLSAQDKHVLLHTDNNFHAMKDVWRGENACPSCGAPICPICDAAGRRKNGWRPINP